MPGAFTSAPENSPSLVLRRPGRRATGRARGVGMALDQMNVRLHQVVSDVNGETGLRILDAILAGERDAKNLVNLRDERIKRSTPEQMVAALQGDWREEQLFILQQARETYRFVET